MSRTLRFLCVSDLRGDFDVLRSMIASAQGLRAQAIFLLGNTAGPLLSETDFAELRAARLVLLKEYETHRGTFRRRGILSLWDLASNLTLETGTSAPDLHRAAREIGRLLGSRNRLGRILTSGVALSRASTLYQSLTRVLASARIPCYVMADTCLFEEHVPERHWLHYGTFLLEGYSVSGLGAVELIDADAIPELAAGPNRKGQLVRLNDAAFWKSEILLAYDMGPDLHEVLSGTRDRLVVLSRPAPGYDSHTVADLESCRPALFVAEDRGVTRTAFVARDGRLVPDSKDGTQKSASSILRRRRRRQELETAIRIAGLGRDLLSLFDFVRARNPELAERLDRSENRAQVLLEYIDHLESERRRLLDLLAAERIGAERLIHRILPRLRQDLRPRLEEAMSRRLSSNASVGDVDRANLEIMEILDRALA